MWIFMVLSVLFIAYGGYAQAKQQGTWHWGFFLGLLGAIALLVFGIIVPLSRSNLSDAHPNVLVALIVGSALLFPVGVIVVARRVSKNWVVKG